MADQIPRLRASDDEQLPKIQRPSAPGAAAGAATRRAVGTGAARAADFAGEAVRTQAAPYLRSATYGLGFAAGLAGGADGAGAGARPAASPTARPPAPAAPPPGNPSGPTADFSRVTGSVSSGPRLTPGDPNTFTGGDGRTRSVRPAAAAEQLEATPSAQVAPIVAGPSTAQAVQGSTGRAVAGQRNATLQARGDAAEFLNPMSSGGEIMRRARTAASTMRGSPSARAAVVNAYLGQLGAQNQASATGQAGSVQALQQGAAAEAAANEGFAQRQLTADTVNTESSLRQAQLAAEQQRPNQVIRGLDGSTSVLRNDATASTLRDEGGAPIQTQDPAGLTPQALLKSYDQQATAIAEGFGDPKDKAAQVAALRADPLYAPLFSGQQQAQQAGTTLVGYRAGKPIYRDAAGKLFIDEGN